MKMSCMNKLGSLLLIGLFVLGCEPKQTGTHGTTSRSIAERRAFEKSANNEVEKKIEELLGQMTLDEKIGQMTQINNSAIVTKSDWGAGADLKIEIVIDTAKLGNILRKYHVGSFLNGIAVPPATLYKFYKDLQEYNMKVSR